jgi:hypothetical protein
MDGTHPRGPLLRVRIAPEVSPGGAASYGGPASTLARSAANSATRPGVSAVSVGTASAGLAAGDEGTGTSGEPLLANSASRDVNAASTTAASAVLSVFLSPSARCARVVASAADASPTSSLPVPVRVGRARRPSFPAQGAASVSRALMAELCKIEPGQNVSNLKRACVGGWCRWRWMEMSLPAA